jgi:hypothetical protein
MTIREQFTTTLSAIADFELRSQVRRHLVMRYHGYRGWVVKLVPDHDWECKAIARIITDHGHEPALPIRNID